MVGGVLHSQAGTQIYVAIIFRDYFSLFERFEFRVELLAPELVCSIAQSL